MVSSLPQPMADTRLLVGDGSCARSVGSALVISALRAEVSRRGVGIDVVPTGCDGRCFEAVAVTHVRANRVVHRWTEVTPRSAVAICSSAALLTERSIGHGDGADPFFNGQRRMLLAYAGSSDPESFDDALRRGAYRALSESLARRPEEITDAIERADLRGMGGAFFPTARKWRSCVLQPPPRYLVVNAEEGEPGVFKDRHLMEDNPHRLIEGALIAAYAIGTEHVFVYVNGLARLSSHRMARALEEAMQHGLVGKAILGSAFSCHIEIREGAGGYVLGEESVILESIEGRRPMPRFRPPHVTERGLWGHPTVVDNVETLSRVPAIVLGSLGCVETPSPTDVAHSKLVCVTGDVQRPGLVEIPFGTTVREVILGMAGGPSEGRALKAVLTGGPSGKLVPPALLDRPLQPSETDVLLGSGNLIALDERRSIVDAVRRLARFNAHESCGKCTPCREGAPRLARLLDGASPEAASDELRELSEIVQGASLCGLGRMAPNPILSALEHFPLAQTLEGERP